MFKVLDTQDHYLGVEISGEVDKLEYSQALSFLKDKFKDNSEVDLLIDIRKISENRFSEIWRELEADILDFRGVRRLALVGGKSHLHTMEKLVESAPSESKYFLEHEMDQARDWVH